MNQEYSVGSNAKKISEGVSLPAISKIILVVDEENAFEAGDDTGYALEIYCPYGTQQMANNLLAQAQGFVYTGYSAESVQLPPEAELGDGIEIGDTYGMLAFRKFSFTPKLTENISAPLEREVEHEYSYEGTLAKAVKRKLTIGASYYGTSITRQRGLEIKHYDSLGNPTTRATLNSETLAFYNANGSKAFYYDSTTGEFKISSSVVVDLDEYEKKADLSTDISAYIDTTAGTAKIVSACSATYLSKASAADQYETITAAAQIAQAVSDVQSEISLSASYGSGTIGSNVRALIQLVSNADSSSIEIKANKINFSGVTTFLRPGDNISQLANNAGYQTSTNVTTIIGNTVTTGYIEALNISVGAAQVTGTLTASQIDVSGVISAGNISIKSVTLSSVAVYYALSTSSTTAPSSGWSTTAPAWESGKYMWQKTVWTFANGSTSQSAATCISGAKGETGTSVRILGSYNTYAALIAAHSTGSEGDGYLVAEYLYVWNGSAWQNVGQIKGDKGDTGTGITSIETEYYLSTSKITTTGGSWSTNPPVWAANKYIWTRSHIVWDDGAESYTNAEVANAINSANEQATAARIAVEDIEGNIYYSGTTEIDGGKIRTGSITALQINATNLHVSAANIDGKLTASQINANGITASNVTVSGTITATSGNVGGWVITASRLYHPQSAGNNGVGMYYSGGATRPSLWQNVNSPVVFYAGALDDSPWPDSSGNCYFGVLADGSVYCQALKATGAIITGRITATAGVIGNQTYAFTIGATGSNANIYCGTSSMSSSGQLGASSNRVYIGTDGMSYKVNAVDSALDYTTVIRSGIVMAYGDVSGSGNYNRAVVLMTNGIIFCNAGAYKVGNTRIRSYEVAMIELPNGSDYAYLSGTWKSASSISVTSDRNQKHSIENLDDRYSLIIDKLKPRRFKYNDGQSDRYHTGFIAQEVKESMDEVGLDTKDLAAYVAATIDGDQTVLSLRYEEFIALNIWAIQKLKQRVARLEAMIGGQ